jgi:hypothetical protein
MGFFKSVKKKLSIFKRQIQDILPNEIKDNPAVAAALIIGGSSFIPFGQSQQSLFSRGVENIGNMTSDPAAYFSNLNDTLGMGKSSAIKSKDLFTTSTGIVIKSKPSVPEYTGFLGKTIQGTRNLLDSSPTGKKVVGNLMQKYLKDELSTGEKLQAGATATTRNTSYRTGTNTSANFRASASSSIKPGYRNRYVQSSVFNILNNPNYKAIWSGGINSGGAISTSFIQASGPRTKLESSKI